MTEQLFIPVNAKVVPTPQPRQASCLQCKPAARPCVSNSSPTVRLHVPHFSFPFFSFADNCWCLLCLRDPGCSGVDIAVFVVWARFGLECDPLSSGNAAKPDGIGKKKELYSRWVLLLLPVLLAIHPRWHGIILCFINNRISCHWKGYFSAMSRSSLCVSLSCVWHFNLAVIFANIHHLSRQHGVHYLASCSDDKCVFGLLCMLISVWPNSRNRSPVCDLSTVNIIMIWSP